MTGESSSRGPLLVVLALAFLLVVAALWLPRWWENRLYRQSEKIAGVGAAILPGDLTEARKKIDPGMTSEKAVAAIGQPSLTVRTQGSSTHEVWTYYFAAGTMTVNLSDGVIKRIGVDYHPPKIPTSARP